ncbi:MAG: glycerol-3-phosphate responsive antiterminator [Firmicutes bacterium]|nr:glycerol-3-phosphate responsive antiterminator [Bacillota bacterium]
MSDLLLPRLRKKPVIAGVKSVEDALLAVEKQMEIIFFLTGTLFDLQDLVKRDLQPRPLIFAHVDLLQGIGKDQWGMRFLAQVVGVDGILTTRSHLVKAAKKEGLLAIQRLFVLDSEALKTGLSIISSSAPDAIEILPALILPHIHQRLPVDELPPIIAGGLIETVDELKAVLRTPAMAVSTSRQELWSTRWASKQHNNG